MTDKAARQLEQLTEWIDVNATAEAPAYRVAALHRDLVAAFPDVLEHEHPERFPAAAVTAMASTLDHPSPTAGKKKLLGVLMAHYRAHRPDTGPWSPERDRTHPAPLNLRLEPFYNVR